MKFRTVLLIDDSDVDNYINRHLVSQKSIAENIIIKSSAIDALDYLREPQVEFPELILLDIRMPGMDGFGFLEQFSGFPVEKKSQTHIVMLTSSQDPKDIDKAKNNPHVIEYVNKPLNKDKLSNVLLKFESD